MNFEFGGGRHPGPGQRECPPATDQPWPVAEHRGQPISFCLLSLVLPPLTRPACWPSSSSSSQRRTCPTFHSSPFHTDLEPVLRPSLCYPGRDLSVQWLVLDQPLPMLSVRGVFPLPDSHAGLRCLAAHHYRTLQTSAAQNPGTLSFAVLGLKSMTKALILFL